MLPPSSGALQPSRPTNNHSASLAPQSISVENSNDDDGDSDDDVVMRILSRGP
jgi:hypothetical protein